MVETEVCLIKADKSNIENILEQKFGDVLRWAIVGVNDDKFKVTVSYIKQKG